MTARNSSGASPKVAFMIEQTPLERIAGRSLVDEATDQIRVAIIEGSYEGGAQLVERRIGADLGIGTIAVREALGRLEAEGLVLRVPRRGAFVRAVTADAVRDLSRTRIAVEQLAVELAIENWTPELTGQAQTIIDLMAKSGRGMSRPPLWQLDQSFHRLFAEASGSESLMICWRSLDSRVGQYLRFAARTVGADEQLRVVTIHQRWLDAVKLGSVPKAKALVLDHVSTSCKSIVDIIAKEGPP